MEVVQWTSLWNAYKDEFENEKSMLGGSLGDKAAEDLRQRVIEHVSFPWRTGQLGGCCFTCQCFYHYSFAIYSLPFSEHSCCFKILRKDHLEETCRAVVPQYPGLLM